MRPIPTAALVCLAAAACADPVPQGAPNSDLAPAFAGQTRADALPATPVATEVFASGLDTPWGIAALPDGSYLVSERSGALRLVSAEGQVSRAIEGVPRVDARRQGGLLDVAVAGDFAETRRVWLTYAKRYDGGTGTTVAHGVLSADGSALTDVTEIFLQEPPSPTPMHYGSRIVFEPGTGNAFVTLGEHSAARERVLAQDIETTYGKVVRIDALTGAAPAGNPFVGREGLDTIWSYGHRNPQGADIHPGTGALWTVEHGPRGGDELNLPGPGLNYGWPVISYGIEYRGDEIGEGIAVQEGMEQPVYYWDPVIAPGGMDFYEGSLFPGWQGDLLIGGLAGQALVRLKFEGDRVVGEERVVDGIGRVRDVEVAADGSVLVLIDAPAPFGEIVRITPGG